MKGELNLQPRYTTSVGLSLAALVILIMLVSGCGGEPPTPTPAGCPKEKASPNRNLPPVILVHGYKGTVFPGLGCDVDLNKTPTPIPYTSRGCDDFNSKNRDNPVENDLYEKGYDVYRVSLNSSSCYTPRVISNVLQLKTRIDEVKTLNAQKTNRNAKDIKVILVAHSMGGLVSRAYAELPTAGVVVDGKKITYEGDVSHIITLGSPHTGVNISSRTWVIYGSPKFLLVDGVLANQAVMEDFRARGSLPEVTATPGGMEKQFPKRNPGVTYHLIDGYIDGTILDFLNGVGGSTVKPEWKGAMLQYLAGNEPLDGLVPSKSGYYLSLQDESAQKNFSEVLFLDAHSSDLGNPDYFVTGSEARLHLVEMLGTIANNQPTPTVAPTRSAPTSASLPRCSAEIFTRVLERGKDDPDVHLEAAMQEYAKECNLGPTFLVAEGITRTIPVNVVSIQGPDVSRLEAIAIISDGVQTGVEGLNQDRKVENIQKIQGAEITSQPDAVYIFYPAGDVTLVITGSTGTMSPSNPAASVTVQWAKGRNGATLQTEKTEEFTIEPGEIGRVRLDPNSTISPDVLIFDRVSIQDPSPSPKRRVVPIDIPLPQLPNIDRPIDLNPPDRFKPDIINSVDIGDELYYGDNRPEFVPINP